MKIRYIYILAYYSAVKKNEIMKFVGKMMLLEKKINEVIQTPPKKNAACCPSLVFSSSRLTKTIIPGMRNLLCLA